MAISSAGVGSGLDINGIIAQLMFSERQTRIAPKQAQSQVLNSRLSLFGQIKSALDQLNKASLDLNKAFRDFGSDFIAGTGASGNAGTPGSTTTTSTTTTTFTNTGPGTGTPVKSGVDADGDTEFIRNVTFSNPNIVNVNNIDFIPPGTYEINVQQFASAQELRFSNLGNGNAQVGGGSLLIEFGEFNNGVFSPDGTNVTLNIAENATKNEIRDAINNANIGLTATNQGNDLVITGQDGKASGFRFSVTAESDQQAQGIFQPATGPNNGNVSDQIGFSRLNSNFATRTDSQDSLLSIDGQQFSSATNTFTGVAGFDITALQLGVTELLVENGAANPLYDESTDTGLNGPPPPGQGNGTTTVTSETTTTTTSTPASGAEESAEKTGAAAVESALTKFTEAYNNLIKLVKDNQKKESRLDSDRTPREIENRLRGILNQVIDGQTKFQVGFEISKEGVLSIDKSKLRTALEEDGTIFDRLFVNGFGKGITDFVNQTNGSSGTLNLRTQTTRDAIDRISNDIERQERLLQSIQDRYRAQFTGLDSLLANLQQSSLFLSQQLGGLNAI